MRKNCKQTKWGVSAGGWWHSLCVIAAMLFLLPSVSYATDPNYHYQDHLKDGGYLDVRFGTYYDSWNPDIFMDPNRGQNYIEITDKVTNERLRLCEMKCNRNKNGYTLFPMNGIKFEELTDYGKLTGKSATSGEHWWGIGADTYAFYRVHIPARFISHGFKLFFRIYYERKGSDAGAWSATWNFGAYDMEMRDPRCDYEHTRAGNVRYSWSQANDAPKGFVYFTDEDNNMIELDEADCYKRNGASYKYYAQLDRNSMHEYTDENFKKRRQIYLKVANKARNIRAHRITQYANDFNFGDQTITGNNYASSVISSDAVIANAYVWPDTASVVYTHDKEKGLAKFQFYLQHENLNKNTTIVGDKVQLVRSWKNYLGEDVDSVVSEVPYEMGQGKPYKLEDDYRDSKMNGIVRWTIRRSDTQYLWGTNFGPRYTAEIETKMPRFSNPKVVADTTDHVLRARITWDYEDGTWPEGSGLHVFQQGYFEEEEVTPEAGLTREEARKGVYLDDNLQSCVETTYRIQFKPGSNEYLYNPSTGLFEENKKLPCGTVTYSEIGHLLNLKASKGYYNDRVEVSFDVVEPLHKIRVFRAVYGQPFNKSVFLYEFDNTLGNQASRTYVDEKAVPGTYYTYYIVGTMSCEGGNVQTDPLSVVGFCTATGTVYGQICFEGGAAEPGVTVYAETKDETGLVGKSIRLEGGPGNYLSVDSPIEFAGNHTVQAMVCPESEGSILRLGDRNELEYRGGKYIYTAGGRQVSVERDAQANGVFEQITATQEADTLRLYINGVLKAETTGASCDSVKAKVLMGRGMKGNLDEVRLWEKTLSSAQVERDFNRYLHGGEDGMLAYWRFNDGIDGEFYDLAHDSNDMYYMHDGVFVRDTQTDVIYDTKIPEKGQLAYKGVTDADGSYVISGLPYSGTETLYTLTPVLGTHNFTTGTQGAATAQCMISADQRTHEVNFSDKSFFRVSGFVYYSGGTVPSPGVMFKIDNEVQLDSEGNFVTTDTEGRFSLSVPVGIHKVQAFLANHTFELDGRICNSDGSNRNYQDSIQNIHLYDNTRVRFIGRVAGGVVQEAYPLGHSLSKNNLGDELVLTLQPKFESGKYAIANRDSSMTYMHDRVLHMEKIDDSRMPRTNVKFSQKTITIQADPTTGEFVADLLPLDYNVTSVTASGYGNLLDSNESMNLTNVFDPQYSINKNVLKTSDGTVTATREDSVFYNYSRQFIKRTPARIELTQTDKQRREKAYYGDEKITIDDVEGEDLNVTLYDKATDSYLMGNPVYKQGVTYYFKVFASEHYPYYNAANQEDPKRLDKVALGKGKLVFTNNLVTTETIDSVEVDSTGLGYYSFECGTPDLSANGPAKTLSLKYVDGDAVTMWNDGRPLNGIVLGSRSNGKRFVTKGPDRLSFILRDPPGSHSYAYLEKGFTRTESSTFSWSLDNEGSEMFGAIGGGEIGKILHGVITMNQEENEISVGVVHSESTGHEKGRSITTTYTERIETSGEEDFVGADGDLFVGNSTNISYGPSTNLRLIEAAAFNQASMSKVSESADGKFYLIQDEGISFGLYYGTHFMYPQKHIEEVLIPEMEMLRNSFLQPNTLTDANAQTLAQNKFEQVYRSNVSADSPDFGKKGTYKIFFPVDSKGNKVMDQDTINIYNQNIDKWYEYLAQNEMEKVKAKPISGEDSNMSFSGGLTKEKSAAYSVASSSQSGFTFTIGAKTDDTGIVKGLFGGFSIKIEEQLTTTEGWTQETDLENSTTMGFVLSEDAGDYLSVDICRYTPWDYLSDKERNNLKSELEQMSDEHYGTSSGAGQNYDMLYGKYGSFVYKTKGGATSCPYEGEYTTKYYTERGKAILINEATSHHDAPTLSVPKNTVKDLSEDTKATFVVNIGNASETKQDRTYLLTLDPESNPNGAIVKIAGTPLNANSIPFTVPYGKTLQQTLEIERGAAAYDYQGLKLILSAECDEDIAAEQTINASWVRQAGDVAITEPQENWILNTTPYYIDQRGHSVLPVKLEGYDVNSPGFMYVALQYKTSAGSNNDWTTVCRFYATEDAMKEAYGDAQLIETGGVINYTLDMQSMGDNNYDLRAACYANIGGNETVKYSAIVSGLKDVKRPTLYGNISPEDGVLDFGDDIELVFNEPINESLITDNNFVVTGTKAGKPLTRAASVRFDGVNDCLYTEVENNLEGKDFTVETGLYIDKLDHDATIFSFGKKGEAFQLGINDKKKLTIQSGGKSYTAPEPLDLKTGEWEHIGAIYQTATDVVSVYYNGESVWDVKIERPAARGVFTIGLGADGKNGFEGKLSEFRIWNRAQTRQHFANNRNVSLPANQMGLYSYYPLNEGRGRVAADKARGANAIIGDATWFINRDGYALALDKTKLPAAQITMGSTPMSTDDDFTLEFWFRGEKGQRNVALFSNGQGMKEIDCEDHLTIGFNEKGALSVQTYGLEHVSELTESQLLDDAWHHLALTTDRNKNVVSLYVDGAFDSHFAASNIRAFMAPYATLGCRTVIPDVESDDAQVSRDMYTYDRGFNGAIDDVRLWCYAKSGELIDEECNKALRGDEKGLVAYYPFEKYINWQGTQEMQFTAEDLSAEGMLNKNPDLEGSGTKSTDTAPVQEAGSVDEITVNWTVNKDGMIITPAAGNWKEFDQTILTFRVTGLQDLHGNTTKSPVAFRLYVDQSQTRWAQDEVNMVVDKGQGATFTVDAENVGGANMRYTIENQPSWLTVTPASGTLSPRSSEHVTFRVDKAVNPGTYHESVYLTNDEGLSRKLKLTIKVRGNEPNWSVDPHEYAYSMNVVGQLKLDGELSQDEEDIIGAFDGEKCVGVAKNVYNASKGLNYTFLTIYGNETKGTAPLTFRVWDASSDRVFTASSSTGDITFANNAVLGSVESPVTFTTDSRVVEDVAFAKGWNWISFNIAAANISDINAMLKSGTWNDGDEVKTETSLASYSVKNGKWMGTLSGFNYTSLFKVKTGKGQTLSFEGVPVDVASTEIPIQSNWNYISYLPTQQLSPKEALAGYNAQKGDILKSQTGFAQYDNNNGWVGNIDFMEPGKGYMLFRNSTKSTSFKYPSSSSTTRRAVRRIAAADPEEMYMHPYASNMSMIAITQGYELQEGDDIVVYAGDERRSFADQVNHAGQKLWFITVEGEEEVPLLFTVENNGETVATGKSGYAFAPDVVCGTLERPIELTLTGVRQGVKVSPVAFDTQFTVTVNQPGAQHVDVKVYSPSGQQIMSHSANGVGGAYSHQFNGSSLARGSYLVRVTVDGEPTTINVIRR